MPWYTPRTQDLRSVRQAAWHAKLPYVAIIGDNGFRETGERAQRTGWQRSSKSLEKGKRVPLGGGPPQPPALLSRFGGV